MMRYAQRMPARISSLPKIVTVGLGHELGGRNQGGVKGVHYRPNFGNICYRELWGSDYSVSENLHTTRIP